MEAVLWSLHGLDHLNIGSAIVIRNVLQLAYYHKSLVPFTTLNSIYHFDLMCVC